MNTRIFLFILILLQASVFSTCKHQKKTTKIGFSLHGYTHDRWKKDQLYIEEMAKEVGVEVIVSQADNSVQKQFDQIEEMLNMGIEAILVVPVNSDKMENIVNLSHSYRVPIIAYDRMANNCKVDYYVSFDNVKVGELQAKYLTKIKPKGKYALLWGSETDQNAMFFKLGQVNIIMPLVEKGDIDIVFENFVPEWSSFKAYEITKKFLKKEGRVDAILATNDELANGVIKALEEADLIGKVIVSGMDADLSACQRIANRTQTMSVYKPIKLLAKEALIIAKTLAEKGTIPNPRTAINNGTNLVPATLLEDMIALNYDNLKETVISDGFHTEKEIYGK